MKRFRRFRIAAVSVVLAASLFIGGNANVHWADFVSNGDGLSTTAREKKPPSDGDQPAPPRRSAGLGGG